MSHQCYFTGCQEVVVSSCSCSDSLFMCMSHTSFHVYSYGDHAIKKFFFNDKDKDKNSLIEITIKNKKFLIENIKIIKSYTNQVIKKIEIESTRIIKEMNEHLNVLNRNLKILLQKSLINEEDFELIRTNSEKNYIQLIIINHEIFERGIKNIFNFNPWIGDSDQFVILFDYNHNKSSSSLLCVDFDHLKKKIIDFKLPIFVINCICSKIDEDHYFIYGGSTYNDEISKVSIINIKNNTVKQLPSRSKRYCAGSCLINEEIFIFGGYSDTSCVKFKIKSETWQYIQNLPNTFSYTSASYFNNSIYVAGDINNGDKQFYLKYDRIENKFIKLIYEPIQPGTRNALLIENFFIDIGGALFEIDKNDNFHIRSIFKFYCGGPMNSSAYFKRGKFLYFCNNSTYCVYRICRVSKKIEQLYISY